MNEKELINSLKEKIYKIVDLQKRQEADNILLQKEIIELRNQLEDEKRKSRILLEQYSILKLSKTIDISLKDKKDANTSLDKIMREIDECIKNINSLYG